jgi:hypothetical protein
VDIVLAKRWLGVVAAGALFAAACSSPAETNATLESAPPETNVTSTTSLPGAETTTVAARGPGYREDDSAYLFDQASLRTFELTLTEEDLAFLDGDPVAEEYVPATLTFDGRSLAVGLRYKGSVGAFVGCLDGLDLFDPSGVKTCTKLSMKVRINFEDPDAEFFGQRRLQFHSMNNDPTQMHERLGYWLFGQMGVPAPRSVHARVVINGELVGLFAMTEQIDGRFTRHKFPDGTGNLYKEAWPFTEDGTVTPEQVFVDALRSDEDDGLAPDIIRSFAQELIEAGASGGPDVLAARTNLDELLAYAVVDRTIRHDDGPFHWYCDEVGCNNHNYYWYENPSDQTVHLIAWDLDNAFENIVQHANPVTPIADGFGEVSADCEPFAFGAWSLRQRSAACDPLVAALADQDDAHQRVLDEFLAGPFAAEQVEAQLVAWEAQIADVTDEANALHPDAISDTVWKSSMFSFRRALAHARGE